MLNAKRLFGYLATGAMPEMTALDAAIRRYHAAKAVGAPLKKDGKPYRKHLTYRERWYLKYGLKNPRGTPAGKGGATAAQDAAVDLKAHDDQYHGGRYTPDQKCKLRDTLARGDEADASLYRASAARQKPPRPSWITPEMDAEYAEAFDAYEAAEASGDRKTAARFMSRMHELIDFHAKNAFAKSAVKDADGNPKVLYHGTEKGGFTEFDCNGSGKTKGTGAWFSDNAHNAAGYGGSDDFIPIPRITEKHLRDNGYLTDKFALVDANGSVISDAVESEDDAGDLDISDDWIMSIILGERNMLRHELRAELEKKGIATPYGTIKASVDEIAEQYPEVGKAMEGAKVKPVFSLEDGYSEDQVFANLDDALAEARRNASEYVGEDYEREQSCTYSVYVNMEQPEEFNAHGHNWDEIPESYNVYVRDRTEEDGEREHKEDPYSDIDDQPSEWQDDSSDKELVDSFGGDFSEALELVKREQLKHPDKVYSLESFSQTTDDLVRDVRGWGNGSDGVILRNVYDGGGNNYTNDLTNDYIVFNPGSIKMTDAVTFDDNGDLIPLSRRFDFANADIRY